MAVVRVLLADPNHVTRVGTRTVLEGATAIVVAGEAADGASTIDLAEELRPHVLLMEVRFPDMTGVELIRHLRQRHVEANVLVLSACDDPYYVFGIVAEEAAGYLTKDEPLERVIAAVHAVAQGGRDWFSPRVARRIRDRAEEVRMLSPREIEVLQFIAKGMEGEEIAERLALSSGTVKNHVAHILEKIGARTRAQAVAWAFRQGML